MKKLYDEYLWAMIPIVSLIILILSATVVFEIPPHIPLVITAFIASIMGLTRGYKWEEIEEGMIHGIVLGLKGTMILIVVGILIGIWIGSGIVPSMIYYGLMLIHPAFFLMTTLVICCVVSLATGSSWSTAGTVGLAIMGIAGSIGAPLSMTAGAIISGAYFGDKMSPLSDTTNLAPGTVGVELFTHIRHMIFTTFPALLISLVLYGILDFINNKNSINPEQLEVMIDSLQKLFHLSPFLLLAPLAVIVMVILKIPAIPALFFGSIIGALLAWFFQGAGMKEILGFAFDGYQSSSGIQQVDELLTRGGIMNMMYTVALILCALSLGGILEKIKVLEIFGNLLLKIAVTTGMLIMTTIITCIAFNIFTAEQYISIIIPGRMYKDAFIKKKLHLKNLSRCLEDSATLTSPLIPWSTCGAFMFGVLGVSPLVFLPFAFLNYITPMISIIYGFTGFSIEKVND